MDQAEKIEDLASKMRESLIDLENLDSTILASAEGSVKVR